MAPARQAFWMKLLAAAPAVGLALFVAGLALRPMAETDVFFRLAVGEQVLTTGELPRRNLFSFTHPDHPDLDSAWLFDAGAALLFRAGGYPALVVIKALLLALVFAGAFVLCRRRGAGPVAAAATLAAAALVMSERFVERPHLFSFAGLVAVLLILDRGERRPRLLWLAPIACALWANLHAGAFLGPVVLAAAALGSVLDRRRGPAATPGPHPASIVLVALASAGALLITPVGAGLFRYLAFHIDIHALHPVDEFRAPSWLSDAPLLLFAGATALSLLLVRRPPARWSEILPAAGAGVAGGPLRALRRRAGADRRTPAGHAPDHAGRARTLSGDHAPPRRPAAGRRQPGAGGAGSARFRRGRGSTVHRCRARPGSPAAGGAGLRRHPRPRPADVQRLRAGRLPGLDRVSRAAGCSPTPVCPPTPRRFTRSWGEVTSPGPSGTPSWIATASTARC